MDIQEGADSQKDAGEDGLHTENEEPCQQLAVDDAAELEISAKMTELTIEHEDATVPLTVEQTESATADGGPFPDRTPAAQFPKAPSQVIDDADESRSGIEGILVENNKTTVDLPIASAPQSKAHGDIPVGIVFDKKMRMHEFASGHVECPARVLVPIDRLTEEGVLDRCYRIRSREATDEELLAGHTQVHLDFVEQGYRPGVQECSNDIYFSPDTAACARLSTGCCIQAAESVGRDVVRRSFAMIRPPGHHAEICGAQGFCFYNNVALAALKLLQSGLATRIVVVDWDVHHGNGIQNMLYEDPRILYISVHRGGNFYPNTGKVNEVGCGPGLGYNINIPFPKGGFGDLDYLAVFSVLVEPLCQAFDPDMVLVSAGFDAAEFDPLGGMKVSPECYGHMTRKLSRFASGRIVLALEGGYNLNSVSESVISCMKVLLGETPEKIDPLKCLRPETEKVLFKVSKQLAKLWSCMAEKLVQERWEHYLNGINDESQQDED